MGKMDPFVEIEYKGK
jgi:Ca2+-dependent lipid-binding protein